MDMAATHNAGKSLPAAFSMGIKSFQFKLDDTSPNFPDNDDGLTDNT